MTSINIGIGGVHRCGTWASIGIGIVDIHQCGAWPASASERHRRRPSMRHVGQHRIGGTRRVVVIGRRSVHHHHQTDQYADGGNKYRPSRATPRRLHRAPGASGTASARAQDRGHPRPLSAPGAAPHFAAAHARPRGRQGNATGHGRRTHCTGTCRAALERPARACMDFFFSEVAHEAGGR